VFDYLLTGAYPSEDDIALMREGKATAPVGKPRAASEVPLGAAAAAAAAAASAALQASAP
jgi:penicillin-binding protein 2